MKALGSAVILSLVAGCATRVHRIPAFEPELTDAQHVVLPAVEAEDCGLYVFFIDWAHVFSNQRTRITGTPHIPFVGPRLLPEESRGLYFALEQAPEATHLIGHRAHLQTQGVAILGRPLFGERCAAVVARPARVGE